MKFFQFYFLLCCSASVFAQSSLAEIFSSSRSFAAIVMEGEAYFAAKYPGLDKSVLATGVSRDGEYVKFQRWQHYWREHLNADGTLGDPTAYFRAVSKLPAATKSNNPYADEPWTEINYTGYITGQIGLGRTTSIGFHPTDVNTFYVGAAIGGVWKTTDGGQSYVPLGDDLPFMAVSSIVVDKNNPSTIYIAISDHVWYGPAGIGVYKSTDGGLSWAPTSLSFNFGQDVRIYWVEASPTDSDVMLAATANGLYRTTDGWNTNTRVLTGGYFDVKFQPNAGSIVYAGAKDGRVLRSDDAGSGWQLLDDFGAGDVLLGVTALDDQKIYVRHDNKLYRSADGGATFSTPVTMNESNEVFVFAPDDDAIILSGNFETHRSNNGGVSFTKTSDWLGRSNLPLVHVDQRNMFVNPLDPDAVYYCNDGGVYRYLVATDEFINLSDGLAITQYYDIAVAQTDANIVGGGSQDNGNVFRNSAGQWEQYASTGDGMNQEIDPTDANYRYWAYQNGGLQRYHNGSNTSIKPSQVTYSGAWETPYKLDPNNPARIVAGYRRVYASDNRGSSWTAISGELAGGRNLNELAIAPANSDYIYTTQDDDLFVTTDGGGQWTQRSLPAAISDIEVDPNDPQKLYVSIPNYQAGSKVYLSENAGASWINLSGSLPNVSVGALELYHDVPGAVFVGTDAGVYYRDAQVNDWLEYGDLPHTRVEDIEIQYAAKLIRVGTHGRGVLEAPLSIQACTVSSPDGDQDGICDDFDACPDLDDGLLGTSCDDGDALSSGETYGTDCNCGNGRANLGYCTAEGTNGTGADYINYVSLNGVENSSGQTNYSDFRSVVIPVNIGETYTLTAGFDYAFDIDRLHAWIDWDRDGNFAASEKLSFTSPVANQATAQMVVPANATLGATTLRVRGVYSTTVQEPCGSYFGEVEDYTISVSCAEGNLACLALPLVWTDFRATSLGKQSARISWETADESDLDRFLVERSLDGEVFAAVGEVLPANRTTANYEFIDEGVTAATAYYRIASYDLDGTRNQTRVRRVNWSETDKSPVIFPNPATGTFTLGWYREQAQPTQYYLYNAYGQEVRRGDAGAAAGANAVQIPTGGLATGLYLVRLRTKDWDWAGEVLLR